MKRMMKNRCFDLFIFACVFYLFMPALKAEDELPFPDPEATVSMEYENAKLNAVLKVFSIQSGLNFIASEAVKERTVTLYMDNVPIKDAMDKIFKANNLSYELDEDSNIFIVKDWGTPQVETVTKVFRLKHATVSSSALKGQMSADMSSATSGGASGGNGITEAITKLLSANGVVVEDPRTNSLIITDIPSKMPVIAQTIALLDVLIPQVLIEVEMLDVSKDVVDRMGFEHGNNPFTFIFGSRHGPFGAGGSGMDMFIGDFNKRGAKILEAASAGSILLGRTFAETLDFLRTQTDTKYLARPRILTLNNETAEIKITTQETMGSQTVTTTSEGNSTQTVEAERTETGVSLRVTPQVSSESGEITMFLVPIVKDAARSAFSVNYRDPEERSTKSVVRVKDGDTVMMGGLIRNEFSQATTKLPILGDIPMLGALFRHKNKTKDKQRELLVFITPHILKDKNLVSASERKAALPAREQSKVSTFDRQLAIAASLNNFEKAR